jgi:hypothetical protein
MLVVHQGDENVDGGRLGEGGGSKGSEEEEELHELGRKYAEVARILQDWSHMGFRGLVWVAKRKPVRTGRSSAWANDWRGYGFT